MPKSPDTPLASPTPETFLIDEESRQHLQESTGKTALYGASVQDVTEGEMLRQRIRLNRADLKELRGIESTTNTVRSSQAQSPSPEASLGVRVDKKTRNLLPEIREAKDILDAQRWALTDLAEQLKPAIEDGVYDSLIGDDVSGRLPTLFMYRLMERHAQDSGIKPPNIIFAAPNKHPQIDGLEPWEDGADEKARAEKNENMRQYFSKQESLGRLGERSLLVTEMIATGENLSELLDSVPDGHQIDIATLVKSPYFTYERREELLENSKFYWAGDGYMAHGQGKITGRAKDGTNAMSHRSEDYDPQVASFAYAYTQKMADEVYEELFTKPSSDKF